MLIIEDDESDARMLNEALRKAGCEPPLPTQTRAEEAVRYLGGGGEYHDRQRFPLPTLIVLDLSLPGMSGLDFLKWVREQPRLSEIPVVVLSGSAFVPTVQQAYQLGAKTFFTKPLDSSALDRIADSIVRYWSASTPRTAEQGGTAARPCHGQPGAAA